MSDEICNPISTSSSSDIDSRVAEVAIELDRIRQRLGADNAVRSELVVSASVESQLELCSKLLHQIDSSAIDLQERLGRVESHNHELSLQLQARSSESQTDGLTGIANRRSFDREFAEACTTTQQSQCPLVLCFLDIDHFKSINDSFGHHVGDAVLRGLAKLLKEHVPKGTLLARYGGEEFAMVFMGLSIDDSIATVEQLRRLVCETLFCINGQSLKLTISSGLAQLVPQEHCEHLMQRADAAMYAAKQSGRNRTFWDGRGQLHLAISCTSDICSRDINECEHSQPIIDLSIDSAESSAIVQKALVTNNAATSRPNRANWCDGAILFWSIRQRLAEWKAGGAPFCVMAMEIDNAQRIAQQHGTMALHFMIRAQSLHLDATLRDMDIVARVNASRMVVVFPNTSLESLSPILRKLHDTMDRFAFPTSKQTVDYSISIGVTESILEDDPQQLVNRAEEALAFSQSLGIGSFSVQSQSEVWKLDLGRLSAS